MQDDVKKVVHDVLTNYIEANNCRKTPERFAILDAVYSMGGYFTLEDIAAEMTRQHFLVSRATLYNTMRLFVELRLVIRHRFQTGTKYEACYASESHCHQICTICGKVTDVDIPEISKMIAGVKLKRFRRECYSLYIYGVCSSCQYRMNKGKAQLRKKR